MEFTVGSVVFFSSVLLLAILARMSAVNPDAPILRGEILPSMLAVLIATGFTIGLMMMALGGVGLFPSRSIEIAVILAISTASVWVVARFVGRAPRGMTA